ncbi:hypothetical protein Tco_1264147 [Tanacetum coccineum]
MLDSQGPIPNKTPGEALEEIQTIPDHSQKWHDGSNSRKVSSGSLDGIVAIANKLDSLGRDMTKLKENLHAIQVGCQPCGGEEIEEVEHIEEAVSHHEHAPREVTSSGLLIVSYYVAPYEPSIPFPRCLKQHAEEALVHKTMESLKKIKEQDLGNFILPCSIGKLTFSNALADLGASASIMPLLMFKWLRIGKLKPINMNIEMADKTKSIPKGIVENLLVKIDKFIFPMDVLRKLISLEVGNEMVIFKIKNNLNEPHIESVCAIRNEERVTDDDLMKIDHDFFLYNSESCIKTYEFNYLLVLNPDVFAYEVYVQESHEEIDYRCHMLDQGEPWEIEIIEDPNKERDIDLLSLVKLNVHWCREILQQKGDEHKLNELQRLGKSEQWEDDDWFTRTINDKDNLDGIVDCLELKSHDDFIDINDEAYKKECANCSA